VKLRIRIGRALLTGWLIAASLPCVLAYAVTTQDATVTVTPDVEVSLTLETSYYVFGPIDINTSTTTDHALRITNTGDVNVTLEKQITDQSTPDGWTAATSSGTDTYVLYCATSTTRLQLSDFSPATQFGVEGHVSALTGIAGSQASLPPTGGGDPSADLWFRLDMPTRVTSSTSRTITIRFTGTAP
jgi:hypothetical protein